MPMLLALLLQAAPVADVVVTGRPLDASASALTECLARGCPPAEDMRAALAHAENQFVAGAYADARITLGKAIGRNKRHAAAEPVLVADLMRANARMNAHLGEAELARINQIESLNALKAGLPATDGRVLVQRLEIADAEARRARMEAALEMYLDVAKDASAAGLPTVEGYARLRRVVLLGAVASYNRGYEHDLRKAVSWFANRPDLKTFGAAARMIAAQVAARKGDSTAIDALIAEQRRTTTRPQLLFAPVAVAQDSGRAEQGGSSTNALSVDDYAGQWVDIGFWIRPDGRVADADVIRAGPNLDRAWVKPILARIGQRRYAPLAMAADEPGLLRVERYSQIADWVRGTRSRIRERSTLARIEMIDLTAEPEVAAKPAS